MARAPEKKNIMQNQKFLKKKKENLQLEGLLFAAVVGGGAGINAWTQKVTEEQKELLTVDGAAAGSVDAGADLRRVSDDHPGTFKSLESGPRGVADVCLGLCAGWL